MKPTSNSYRYVICFCSCLLIFLSIGLLSNVFPIYFPFIIEEHHFTNTQISLLNTMRSISALFCMFITDRYYKRLNLRKGIALALCTAVLSYLIYGLSSSPVLYCLAAAISGICYGLGGMIPASLLIRRWFPTHAATAMGLAAAGTGVASIIGPPIVLSLIRNFGLSGAFLLETLFMAACSIPLMLLIRNSPADEKKGASKASPDIRKAEPDSAVKGRSQDRFYPLTRGQHIRVIAGILLIGVMGLTSFSGLSLLYTTTGHAIEGVSSALSFLGFVLLVGKCLSGILADRFGNAFATGLYGLMLVIGQLMCCLAPKVSTPFIFLTFSFLGIGLSLSSVGANLFATDFSTPERFATVLKNYQLAYTLGGLISSAVPGFIADLLSSYVPAYWLFFLGSAASFLLLAPIHQRIAGKNVLSSVLRLQ